MFSVALAVHGLWSPRPGRYPAHCPAEFGLSSPETRRNAFRQRPPGPPASIQFTRMLPLVACYQQFASTNPCRPSI